jgi:hypothetical protein
MIKSLISIIMNENSLIAFLAGVIESNDNEEVVSK